MLSQIDLELSNHRHVHSSSATNVEFKRDDDTFPFSLNHACMKQNSPVRTVSICSLERL